MSWDIDYAPYGVHVKQQLQEYVSSLPGAESVVVDVVIDGHDGWTTAMLMDFLTSSMCELDLASFDICLLLAGTNDIGHGRSCTDVCQDLLSLHKMMHSNGAKTVAITVPEAGQAFAPLDKVGDGINEWIRHTLSKVDNVVATYDFNLEIPNMSQKDEERRLELWCDNLHMTRRGYRLLATSIVNTTLRGILARHFGVVEQASHVHGQQNGDTKSNSAEKEPQQQRSTSTEGSVAAEESATTAADGESATTTADGENTTTTAGGENTKTTTETDASLTSSPPQN